MELGAALDFVEELSEAEREGVLRELFDWRKYWARPEQIWPEGEWSTWVANAGRGWGKTRAGSEAIREKALAGGLRIALIARTVPDVRDVVTEGESGLLVISPPWECPHYEPSKRRLTWPRPQITKVAPAGRIAIGNQASVATTFSADEPEQLRGPQFHLAWCDELASWRYLNRAWDNLQFGLRLGTDPRAIVTTTPRPLKFLRDLIKDPSTVTTGGSTYENVANLAPKFLAKIRRDYEGTNLGRQELHAEILEEAEGALWKREWIERDRIMDIRNIPGHLSRIVVAVDPAASTTEQSSETGIVVAGCAEIQIPGRGAVRHFYVLEDVSEHYTPHGWGTEAVNALARWRGDRIIGEANNGGDMVESTVRTVDADAPFRKVHASRGKDARAEPISALYEQRRVHHVGGFTALEDQLTNWVPRSGDDSPDRLDAMVWALTELKGGEDAVDSFGDAAESDGLSAWSQT